MVPPRSPAFLREAGKTKAGGNEHIRSFADGPAVSANLPIHSPRASGMFLSLIKLLERQLEPGQGATVCNRVWVCEADGEKKDKNPITVSRRITARCDNISPATKFPVVGYYECVSA